MSAATWTTTDAGAQTGHVVDLQLGAELASGPRAGGKVTRLEINAAGVVSVYLDGDTQNPWRVDGSQRVRVVRPYSAPTRAAIVAMELLEREINALAAAERARDEMLALPPGEVTLNGYTVVDGKLLCHHCPELIGNLGAMTNHVQAKHPDL